mgnify:CR=1 FL=1
MAHQQKHCDRAEEKEMEEDMRVLVDKEEENEGIKTE